MSYPENPIAPQPSTLDYFRDRPRWQSPRWARLSFFLLTLPAPLTIVLDFAYTTSPWEVVQRHFSGGWRFGMELFVVAAPFFLSALIVGWKLRMTFTPRPRTWETAGIFLTSAAALLMTNGFLGYVGLQRSSAVNVEIILPGVIAETLGICAAAWVGVRLRHGGTTATVLLYAAYATNAIICLSEFMHVPQAGWYMTAVVVPILIIECLYYCWAAWRFPRSRP